MYLYLQIEASVLSTSGYFRFLVDGKLPNPGPTIGYWYAAIVYYPGVRSFAAVAQVTGGVHSVEVDFGCEPVLTESNGVTCSATSTAATLKVEAYTP
jgi:hypothetical protein